MLVDLFNVKKRYTCNEVKRELQVRQLCTIPFSAISAVFFCIKACRPTRDCMVFVVVYIAYISPVYNCSDA